MTSETMPSSNGDRSGRLDAAMVEYLAASDAGCPIPPADWLARHADLAPELAAFLDDQRRLGRIVDPVGTDSTRAAEATQLFDTKESPEGREAAADSPREAAADSPLTRVQMFGDYELIKVLGRGGMGIVYLARHVSIGRLVALKMIRTGQFADHDELRRFRNEAEAVARLDHPNLLPIYDVGEVDGRCYFTMPWIDGGSLADDPKRYCGDPRRAAELVAAIAEAIHHAHQRGILHRDLKPANVLIDGKGGPHVSDFGLAKRFDTEETLTGAVLGTPAFMAPEQAAGDRGAVTTATDVYGIGTILYALLTGHSPFSGSSPVDTLRRVNDEVPDRPSKSNRLIGRGLEAICLKCLQKDPKRRYDSAEALADDLKAWLAGYPIRARATGPLLRTWMWCRRKPALAGMTIALAVSLAAGAGGILINWLEIRRQKDLLEVANSQAIRERDAARVFNEFLLNDIFSRSSPLAAPNRAVTVEELLDASARNVHGRFRDRPDLEAGIRRVLADSFRAAGQFDKAEEQINACEAILDGMPDRDEREQFAAWFTKGELLLARDRKVEAEQYARRAYQGRLRELGPRDTDTLDAANLLASVQLALKQTDEAEELLYRTYQTSRDVLGEGHRTTLGAQSNLAWIAYGRGFLTEAEQSFRSIHKQRLNLSGPEHPATLQVAANLGAVIFAQGKVAEAETIFEETLAICKRVLTLNHHFSLTVLNNLASAQNQLGKREEASKSFAALVQGQTAVLGEGHTATQNAKINLAVNLTDRDRYDQAIPLLEEMLPRLRSGSLHDAPRVVEALVTYALSLQEEDRLYEAAAIIDEALAANRNLSGPQGANEAVTRQVLYRQASILLDLGKSDQALNAAREVMRLTPRQGVFRGPKLAHVKSLLGAALAQQRQFTEAEPLLKEGYDEIRKDPLVKPRSIARAKERLAAMYDATNRPEPASSLRAAVPPPAAH